VANITSIEYLTCLPLNYTIYLIFCPEVDDHNGEFLFHLDVEGGFFFGLKVSFTEIWVKLMLKNTIHLFIDTITDKRC
jgi:hypothetical protein